MKNAHDVLFGFISFVLAIMAPISAFAQTEADFEVTLTEDGTGAVITHYRGAATVVKIPDTIQGMPVKEIRDASEWGAGIGVFSRSTPYPKTDPDRRITAVTFPAGLVRIGEASFSGARLTRVVIPNGVTEIGKKAFRGCKELTSVSLPDTLTYIGNEAFAECTSLRSITLPKNLTYLGGSSFAYSGLTSITLPGSLGEFATEDEFTAGTRGGYSCFTKCPNLTTVIISEGITRLPSGIFSECEALASVTLPSTIQIIDEYVFSGCSALTTVTIPDTVGKIKVASDGEWGSDAFEYCSKLPLATQARLKRLGYTGSF